MTSASDLNVQYGAPDDETAKKVQQVLTDEATIFGSARVEVTAPEAVPEAVADEPMLPGTSTHLISTAIYSDSGGHVHAVLIDEHTTARTGTVLEILADVPIN
jgi:hypothetical protein